MPLKSGILLLSVLLVLSHCKKMTRTPSAEGYLSKEVQYKHIPGTEANLLRLDVYYFDGRHPKPVVIWVHGGGWALGDKRNGLENKLRLFRDLGYVFVSVNYRLSPFPYETDNPDRIKFSAHNIDVADAVKWVYDSIAHYGGDRDKIVLTGHSAGAQLVALTGTNRDFLQAAGVPFSAIKGVAVIDTESFDIYTLVRMNDPVFDMQRNAFGTDSLENVRASAIRNLFPEQTYPAFFVVKRGNDFRKQQTEAFIRALENHGADVTQLDASVYTHREVNEAIGKPGEQILTPALKAFLSRCFGH